MKKPCVYMLANKRNGTLYLGVTSDLSQRIWQHKNKQVDGFSKKYDLSMLVYYEAHDTMENAIMREKKLKGSSRARKLAIIEKINPNWQDLYDGVTV
ncbi:MAG: putative endonuclease [Alphaproteobacteria bacterium]|jgi:putative endonuclease